MNTRNEDHEVNITNLKLAHKVKLEEIAAANAADLAALQGELEKQKGEGATLVAKIKKVQAQYKKEKADALAEFDMFIESGEEDKLCRLIEQHLNLAERSLLKR